MNAAEILNAERLAGLAGTIAEGKLIFRGVGGRRDQQVESIRTNKSEIISIIQADSANEAKKAKQAASNPLAAGLLNVPCRP